MCTFADSTRKDSIASRAKTEEADEGDDEGRVIHALLKPSVGINAEEEDDEEIAILLSEFLPSGDVAGCFVVTTVADDADIALDL